MKAFRKLLVKTLGLKNYLRLISKIYISMIGMGMMKKKHPEIHFLKTIVNDGDTCIDIGANLGYYTTQLLKANKTGQIHAVEPVPLFVEVWKKNVGNASNVTLHHVALGSEEKQVKMAIPLVNGVVRHGLTRVIEEGDEQTTQIDFTVEMKQGNQLFGNLEKIDFIKCDVEGHEQYVLASLEEILAKHLPLIQIELGGKENRTNVFKLLNGLSYEAHTLKNGKLFPIDADRYQEYTQDFYFVPGKRKEVFARLLS